MADLGAIGGDVPFDNATADALIVACRAAASVVEGQAGGRSSAVSKGLTDFSGHFSQVFATNAGIASGDATELAGRLREVATGAQSLKDEAAKERQRREVARKWKKEQDDRSWLSKAKDDVFGGDDPPVGPPAAEPSIPVAAAPARARQNPQPGGSGGGGGSTSARPSNLLSFASTSGQLNEALASTPARLKADYADFQARCRWGSLDASGVFAGFTSWLALNDQDVLWASTVADAFKAAGGEGALSTLSNSAVAAALKSAGVSANRQDLAIDPPQAFGGPTTTGYANDPVNTATGNFVEPETDLAFPGTAAQLVLGRCYNSFDGETHAFGPGWSSVVDAGLTFDSSGAGEGVAWLRLPDGRQVRFPRLGAGWDRAVGESLWLEADRASGGLVASGNDGSWWRLSGAGLLLGFGTGPLEAKAFVEVGRDEAGRVVRLSHARGQWVGLEWVGDRVVAASTADGRSMAYSYDDASRLVAASGPAGTRTYGWNPEGLVVSVTDADGVVEAVNVYDDRRRVVSQRSPFGRTTRFVYLPGRVTVVSDEDGTRSNTWIADEKGRLVGVVDADEQRQSTSYDRWGDPVLVTERDGATTVHEYDQRGRRTRTVTPSGADISYGWDHLDRVIAVVTEQGAVTSYGYQGDQRNPSTVLDPEGGLTRLTWTDGLLTQVVDPTGVVVRFGYDDRGELVATLNADGQTARLERDSLGRVTAAVTPSGHRTEFHWDAVSGQLAERRDPDGAVWRYEHTAAGRLTATVDPLGARTTVEYGAHGEETVTLDPLGRAVTRQLDELGNLAAVTLPDGSAWQFSHDALSRLTATTDPTGAVWSRDYDAAGHLVATVDPTGVRVGVDVNQAANQAQVSAVDSGVTSGFDPLGRLTSAGRVDGTAAVYTYDRCGRPVEALDGDGGLTRIERDPAGRPVAVTSPMGAVTRYGYDRCGRLVTVTDPAGGVVEIGYDADGRAVAQTLPTGEVARSTFDACGRLVEHSVPGAGASTWTYDLAGRVVGWTSPQTGQAAFAYDPAGQLVTATDANGGVTRYRSDELGRTVEVVNPMGGVTRREFDAMSRCIAETDPLGRTTRAGYDGAGRLAWQEAADGRRTTWTYDPAGRPTGMAVNGKPVTALTRDLRRRTVTVTDTSNPDGTTSEHELEWNSRGQLVRRARNGRAVTWAYDPDGRRTTMTTPDGTRTGYRYDAAGRLTGIDSTVLGRAAFDRDAAGRIVSAVAGGLIQAWEHRDGFVVAHTMTDGDGATRTTIDRDGDGRVLRVTKDDPAAAGIGRSTTGYGYDAAGQLVSARTEAGIGTATGRWTYDAAGRLIAETIDNQVSSATATTGAQITEHVYDLAGQLLSTIDADGLTTRYSYDAAGRRLWSRRSDGTAREFVWNPTGYLAGIVRHHRDNNGGDRVRRITVHADALGELAAVDGTEFFWDTAGYAGAPVLAGDTPILSTGPVTGIGTGWTAPGWRTTRANGADPWTLGTPAGAGRTGLGAASVGAAGEVSVDGLEWMGARVYDPAARGFLSVDPLDPVTGAGWAGNPYAFAGNDPLHAVDPTGLRPVTDAELQAYRDHNNGMVSNTLHAAGSAFHSAMDATGHWLQNNWEYVAGGAMVIAGGALMVTGVGGPAGAMLISAGADTIIQKATTGSVNWGQVAVSGAAGAVGFGAGGLLAKTALSTGAKEVVANVAEGAVSNGAVYLTGPGPHTVTGLVKTAGFGAATGGVPLRGAASHELSATAERSLAHVAPIPHLPSPASAGNHVQLFRNVDATEFDAIASTSKFTTGAGMMEGKWFATEGQHAEQWGQQLNGGRGITVETGVPQHVADALHYESGKLDGIGTAYYADLDHLDLINEHMDGIRVWP